MRTCLLAALALMALLVGCVPRPEMATLDGNPIFTQPANGGDNP